MTDPYIGEIRIFGGNFAPVGWAFCAGQPLPIGQFDALFNLIGTTYGGDGQQTFNLPDLRGRVPVHQGTGAGLSSRILGETAGSESVTLTANQMPGHRHPFVGTTNQAGTTNATANLVGQNPGSNIYVEDQAFVALDQQSVLTQGGSQPHDNLQPYLCVNFIIALEGIYPPPN
jgi:microcystin-dependent protein